MRRKKVCPDCGGGLLGGAHEPWCINESPNEEEDRVRRERRIPTDAVYRECEQ